MKTVGRQDNNKMETKHTFPFFSVESTACFVSALVIGLIHFSWNITDGHATLPSLKVKLTKMNW